jgi:hypothetical protein
VTSPLAPKDPFADILARAAKAPKVTGETGRYQRRLDTSGTGQVVILDVSSSMAEPAGARTKIEILRDALVDLPPARLLAFSSTAQEIASAADLPLPSGGTALHLALDLAAAWRPARSLVISDGRPDSEPAALASADRLPGTIDVLYCGPDDDLQAKAFLRRLARLGAGRYAAHDLRRAPVALGPAIRILLLPGGSR